jgi:hypothetical protein
MKKPRTFLTTFFIVAAAAAIIVRYVQFIEDVIDFNTGFFHHFAGAVRHLHYIVLGAAFAGIIALAIIEKRRKTRFFTKKLSHFDESDLAFCGIMLLLAGFAVIYTAIGEGLSNLNNTQILTVILGTLAYGFAGGILLFRKKTFPSVGLAFLALSGHYVSRLVMLFLENHIILSMSEHLVRLIITVAMALFFVSAGRMFMRAENKTTRIKACIFGYFAITVAVSEIAAKLVFLLGAPPVKRSSLNSAVTEFIPPDMLLAAETIAVLTFLLCMNRYKSERIKADREADSK